MEATSFRFAAAARALTTAARHAGLAAPAFRSPPRLRGATRSLRRRADGGATVAVTLRERPWAAVVADMVEGVIAANDLAGVEADRVRALLWAAVDGSAVEAA